MYNSSFSLKEQTTAALRSSPRTVLFATIIAALISGQGVFWRFAGYYLIAEFLSVALKSIVGNTFTAQWKYRPPGAGNCRGCGVVQTVSDECIDASKQIGMPSGHSLSLAMAATFWIMWIFEYSTGTMTSKVLRATVIAGIALAVIISRTAIVENCHTIAQVVVGGLIGILVGMGMFWVEANLVHGSTSS